MDKEVIEDLRQANEAAIALLTLMLATDRGEAAANLVESDPRYGKLTTCMALAGISLSAIEALAQALEIPPEAVIQSVGLNAANYALMLEDLADGDE